MHLLEGRDASPDEGGSFLFGKGLGIAVAFDRQPPTVEWADAVDRFAAGERALADDRVDALQHCLGRLGERARQAVQWHHVDGQPRRETGRRLGIGDEGVKSLLARARQALRPLASEVLACGRLACRERDQIGVEAQAEYLLCRQEAVAGVVLRVDIVEAQDQT